MEAIARPMTPIKTGRLDKVAASKSHNIKCLVATGTYYAILRTYQRNQNLKLLLSMHE